MSRLGHFVGKNVDYTRVIRLSHDAYQLSRQEIIVSLQIIINAIADIAARMMDNEIAIVLGLNVLR